MTGNNRLILHQNMNSTSSVKRWQSFIWIFILVILQYLGLELSCRSISGIGIDTIQRLLIDYKYHAFTFILWTMSTIYLIAASDLLLYCLTGRIKLSVRLVSILLAFLSVINFWVYQFKGNIFTWTDIRNAGTAAHVLSGYSIDRYLQEFIKLIVAFILIFLIILKCPEENFWKKKKTRIYAVKVCGVVAILWLMFASNVLHPADGFTQFWNWSKMVSQYGYGSTFLLSALSNVNTPVKPDQYQNYTDQAENISDSFYIEETASSQNNRKDLPDVLVIVNETFDDLNYQAPLSADQQVMGSLDDFSDIVVHKGTISEYGTGTNISETSVLTGFSSVPYQGKAPFLYFDVSYFPSLPKYMQTLGYQTAAFHYQPGANYDRNVGYKKLGFEETHFLEDGKNLKNYGSRIGEYGYPTDESVYQNVESWYEEHQKSGPCFMYCLTMQNHSGYDMNDPSYDTVHVDSKYGELSDEMNEYESCMDLSVQAFENLCSQYKNSDRDLVILMTGDHGPLFLADYMKASGRDESDAGYDEDIRTVPNLFWSNNDDYVAAWKKKQADTDRLSIEFLVPDMLESCGFPGTSWTELLEKIRGQYPVIMPYGKVCDNQNQVVKNGVSISDIQLYLAVEYQCLTQ